MNFIVGVDDKMRIRCIKSGVGSTHDNRLYRSFSVLRNFVESLPSNYHVIGDQAFGSMYNVKIPRRRALTDEDLQYNIILSKQRIIVENTFGLFKSKFKRFKYPIKNGEKSKYIKMFVSAAIIHNLLLE